jgi:hypothetical protein
MFERASPGDDLAAGIGFAFSLFGAGFERLQLCGADATPRNVALFVAPETANDLGQLARQWRSWTIPDRHRSFMSATPQGRRRRRTSPSGAPA